MEIHDSHYHFQELALNHCLHKYGQFANFLGFLDIDEFVIPRNRKLLPVLERYAEVVKCFAITLVYIYQLCISTDWCRGILAARE